MADFERRYRQQHLTPQCQSVPVATRAEHSNGRYFGNTLYPSNQIYTPVIRSIPLQSDIYIYIYVYIYIHLQSDLYLCNQIYTPATLIYAPAFLIYAPAFLICAPATLIYTPAILIYVPAFLICAPATLIYTPAFLICTPAIRSIPLQS